MTRPSRRPRIIGPFFLIAIVISAGLFIWQKQQNERRLRTAPPPVLERQTIQGAAPGAASLPSPEWVQQHANELQLDAKQRQALAPLVVTYQREMRPLQDQLTTALAAFGDYQRQQQGKRAVSLADVQREMSRVSELSGRMAALRQSYWGKVTPLLSSKQQAAAQKLWAESLKPHTQSKGSQP